MSKLNKEYFEMASRLLGETEVVKEDDSKKLIMDFAMALSGYEDFRQDVKEIVSKKYPDKVSKMTKEFAKVDKAMAAVEKFVKGL